MQLLLVIRLHRLRRQQPRTDQRDRKHQQRHRGELPVQEQHQDDAGDQFQERQCRAVGKTLDRGFEGRKVDGKPRQNLAALGPREIARRQVLHMAEQARAHVGNKGCRQPGVPSLVPYRDDRGDDAGCREHPEDHVERLEILLAERIVDQEFEAQRHDDVEQRLDHDADADEDHHFPVVLQKRLDERIDRRKRARGFLRGIDDEILIIVVVSISMSSSRMAWPPCRRPGDCQARRPPPASPRAPAQPDRPWKQASDRPMKEAWAP